MFERREKRVRRMAKIGVGTLALFLMTACGNLSLSSGGFGATQGGIQDLGLAREYVESGNVPPAEAFVVEGLFSEHDLPLSGAGCETILCVRTALGIAPAADGTEAAWLQVGLSSRIDPATWVRPTQTLIFTVDVSGSMGWDYSDDPESVTPGALSRLLMTQIVEQLGPEDRVAVVTYGTTSRVRLDPTAATDAKVQRQIDALSSGGSTNLEAGLRKALSVARKATGQGAVRILLFSDVRPNVGVTAASGFEALVKEGADEGIGTTLFGLGLGLGAETFEAMSHLRGGNAFSLFEAEDVPALMEESWPWMLTPIAYDLKLELAVSEGSFVTRAYGFPAPGEDLPAEPKMTAASVFLSRKRGAMLVQIQPGADVDLAGTTLSGGLSYATPEGQTIEQTLEARVTGEEPLTEAGRYFEQASVGKTVALALLCEAMKAAAASYLEDPAGAVATLAAGLERYQGEIAPYSDDTSLALEVEFAASLLSLMEEGAPQVDLYGQAR